MTIERNNRFYRCAVILIIFLMEVNDVPWIQKNARKEG